MAYIGKLSNEGGVKSLNRYVSMLAGNAAFVDTAYESIATTTVGSGGSSTITFSSIPSTYKHLQIRAVLNNSNISVSMSFNGDNASGNYSDHLLYGDGSSAAAAAVANKNTITFTQYSASGSSIYHASIIDVLDYANTNKYKTVRSLNGYDANGSGFIGLASGSWRSTSAVNSITFAVAGVSWTQYSQIALYGIK